MAISVVVIEDNSGIREKFVNIIASSPAFRLSGMAATSQSGFELIARDAADIYLVDVDSPELRATTIIRTAIETHPGCAVMALLSCDDDAGVSASIQAVVTGYILKNSTSGEVVDRLCNLRDGDVSVDLNSSTARKKLSPTHLKQASLPAKRQRRPVRTAMLRPECDRPLTKREIEIIRVLAKGFSTHEVAQQMVISPHTVAQHVKNIYRKLVVRSRVEAVFEASQMGLLA